MYFSTVFRIVACAPLSGLEYNRVVIGAGIWYQINPVPD